MSLHRLSHQLIELFQSLGTIEAYAWILGILLACGLGVPIPEDVTLISAGIISSTGTISLEGALFAGLVGVLIGDAFLFFLGRRFGKAVYSWPLFRSIFTHERIEQAEMRIQKNAKIICFVARFMPGLRAPIYLTAGTMRVRPIVFLLSDGFAALISVPIWVLLGHWFGTNVDHVLKVAKKINTGFLVAIAIAVLAFFIARKLRTKRESTLSDPTQNQVQK